MCRLLLLILENNCGRPCSAHEILHITNYWWLRKRNGFVLVVVDWYFEVPDTAAVAAASAVIRLSRRPSLLLLSPPGRVVVTRLVQSLSAWRRHRPDDDRMREKEREIVRSNCRPITASNASFPRGTAAALPPAMDDVESSILSTKQNARRWDRQRTLGHYLIYKLGIFEKHRLCEYDWKFI